MTQPLLPNGGHIAVVAPSGIHQDERLAAGLEIIRSRGFQLTEIGLSKPHFRYMAASDEDRLHALVTALTSDEFDAVWMTRGGYGLNRIVSRLPQNLPSKLVIGFSDTTALFCAGHHQLTPVHGPVIHSLSSTSEKAVTHLFSLLTGSPLSALPGTQWVKGSATAPIVGGNLSIIASLCGTPQQLNAAGKLLLIEEINEAPYRVDRLLAQLRAAGVFNEVAGIGFGDFSGCHPASSMGYNLTEILVEAVTWLGVPVVGNLPFGHSPDNYAFVWNRPATIDNGALTL